MSYRNEQHKADSQKWRREWYYRNRKHAKEKINERIASLKVWLSELKSTKRCVKCNTNEIKCLTFHHKNPSEKETDLSQACHNGWSKKRMLKEIEKCIPMCPTCHFVYHYETNKWVDDHEYPTFWVEFRGEESVLKKLSEYHPLPFCKRMWGGNDGFTVTSITLGYEPKNIKEFSIKNNFISLINEIKSKHPTLECSVWISPVKCEWIHFKSENEFYEEIKMMDF